jgi:tyrosinase
MVDHFVSAPIELAPTVASGDYARADLIFDGVDHSLASYEGRVYINAPDVDLNTGRDHPSYAGSFHIFGHGGCFGDAGHCDVPSGPRDPFDLRGPHQLTPATKAVIVTDALKRVVAESADKGSITVTVVAVAPGHSSNEYLRFDQLRLVTYR